VNADTSDTEALIERELTGAVGAFRPPAGLKGAVRERMEAERRREAQPPKVGFRPWLRRLVITAAAACLVVAVLWMTLGGGSTPSAYAELAQALENSQAAEWAHMVMGQGQNMTETWMSFRPMRIFHKTGRLIQMFDFASCRVYEYDGGKRTLTIDYNPPPNPSDGRVREALEVPNLFEYYKRLLQNVKREGAKVTRRNERTDGRDFAVYEMIPKAKTPQQPQLRFFLDPQTNRFVRIDQRSESGQTTTAIVIDYPKTGPTDVYDLGVPRDAKVIDYTPTEPIRTPAATVEAEAQGFPKEYVAITCKLVESFQGHSPAYAVEVTVLHVKAGRCRQDVYVITGAQVLRGPGGVSRRDEAAAYREACKSVPTDSMAALEAWVAQRKPYKIKFEDTNSMVVFSIGKDGQLKQEKFPGYRRPGLDLWKLPIDLYRAEEIKGEKGRWGPLAGIESGQPRRRTQRLFNPARGHVCECYRQWLGQATEPEWTAEVVEYALTPTGRWCPAKTRSLYFSQAGQEVSSEEYVTVCFVDDTREVPDGLFDASRITAELLADTRTPFQREFAKAVKIIDARKDWPGTPEAVTKAYWEARAAKCFDEMAVLWPGSAGWNSRLKAERPVKYVFGKARELEGVKDVVLVPYASADYFRKHGTYNLNMRLTNKKSTKGRYYITSGN